MLSQDVAAQSPPRPPVDIEALSRLPAEACLAYHQARGTLAEEVNRVLEGRPDLLGLIGEGNLELMRGNHANHAAFMDNVFFLGNYHLLARIVPWVYRVYTARGFSLDYFPAELQAWADAVRVRIQPPSSQAIVDVYGWMIRHHRDFAALAEAPVQAAPAAARDLDLDALVAVFLRGDFRAAERLTQAALGEAPDLEALYLRVLDPVLQEIGRRWEQSAVTTAQEHVASALATRMMSAAYAKADMAPVPGKRAVVCSGPHEQHQIGAWMVSDLLEVRGWDARLIGADPSIDGLVSLLEEFRPIVLALSVTMPFHLREAAQLILTIRRRPGLEGTRILVGGQAFAPEPGLAAAIGADGYAPDARSAALIAEGWWSGAS